MHSVLAKPPSSLSSFPSPPFPPSQCSFTPSLLLKLQVNQGLQNWAPNYIELQWLSKDRCHVFWRYLQEHRYRFAYKHPSTHFKIPNVEGYRWDQYIAPTILRRTTGFRGVAVLYKMELHAETNQRRSWRTMFSTFQLKFCISWKHHVFHYLMISQDSMIALNCNMHSNIVCWFTT